MNNLQFPRAAETAHKWEELHRKLSIALRLPHGQVQEGGAPHLADIDERLVQAIWSDQLLRQDSLATASGKAVRVIEPGRWNTGRGPDFLDARLEIAGMIVEGDVEIHTESSGWQGHGHHKDFVYNRVVLHVVLRASNDRPYEERQNGSRLERLVLEHFLEPDLDTIRQTVNLSDYPHGRPEGLGICHETFLRLPEPELTEFLLVSGRARIESKVSRFITQRQTADSQQVLYQALLTTQGFKASKTLYFLLSKRLPLAEVLDHARDVDHKDRTDFFLSLFLHVGRLMPDDEPEEIDDESRIFESRLRALWNPARPYFWDRLMPPTRRWFAGMRPAGFPTRRLTAVALLLGRLTDPRNPLMRQLEKLVREWNTDGLKPREIKARFTALVELLIVDEPAHYFSRHFSFRGKEQPPQALLGEPASYSMLFNLVLPLMIMQSREAKDTALERQAWQVLHEFPALEKNSVVKFMTIRLFGETGRGKAFLARELYQQAMLKVFGDCCAQNERTCDNCTLLALREQLRRDAVRGVS